MQLHKAQSVIRVDKARVLEDVTDDAIKQQTSGSKIDYTIVAKETNKFDEK